jgi:cation/acetate symporter
MISGLGSSIVLIAISPLFMHANAIFPLENPGLISIPLGFLGAILGTVISRDPASEKMFNQLEVRATTGIGAEV